MTVDSPPFTTEALIALAVGYGHTPQPLLLMQLGFDTTRSDARAEFVRVLDRGVRNLASLHDVLQPTDDMRQETRRRVDSMCQSSVFVSLRRSDNAGATVIYSGEDTMVDEVSGDGNHQLRAAVDVESELSSFFGDYSHERELEIAAPITRFAIDAPSSQDEDPLISELASNESTVYLVSAGTPRLGKFEMLRWCATGNELFEYHANSEQAQFKSTSSSQATQQTQTLLTAIQAQ